MTSKLLKKTSFLLVLAMIISMLTPIISLAANVMYFIYRPASPYVYHSDPELTGYVYTSDPDSVSVRANNDSVTQVTYSNIISGFLYDDNNTPYSSVEYNFILGQAPTSLSVDLEGKTHKLIGFADSQYPGVYRYLSGLSANLGSYRMPGQFHIPTVTAATYLPAGSEIVSFTPSRIDNNDGEGIIIRLPYNDDANTTFNSAAMDNVVRDFEIIDQTVSSAVYYNGFTHSTSGELTFNLVNPLVQGHQYLVKLSSTSSGNEIILPTDGIYTASVHIGFWGNGYPPKSGETFTEKNSIYFRNLTIGNPANVPPSDPVPDPNSSEPSSPPATVPGNTPGDGVKIVNEESLRNGTKDKVAVDIANGTKQVLLPANAAKMVGDRQLELKNEKLAVTIPAKVLQKLQNLLPAEQLAGAKIAFSFDLATEERTTELVNKANGKSKAKLKAASDVYELKLSVVGADGKETVLSQFDAAITLRLKVHKDANPALLGIYYIADDGKLEYVGGQLSDGEIVADVTHFSKYAALEYDKTFDDVPEQYWAFDEIRELSAKHIVSGVSDSEFAPQKQMTRAEFAALIARALDLKASKAATFADVDSSNVHADAIAAASEAGIIHGRSADSFAPNDHITREEMVTMIISAYEYKNGSKVASAAESSYSDRNLAAAWAQPYIDAAASIGFVQGRGNGTFAPKNFMTRAEGAQLIYRLLKSN